MSAAKALGPCPEPGCTLCVTDAGGMAPGGVCPAHGAPRSHGFPTGWTVADDSDGSTLPGVLCASSDWWDCHLTTDALRTVIVVEPSHVAGGWRVVEGVMRRHPDGSTSPDDWPSVEWYESREAALAMAMASARGTWAEECPDHGWEAVTPRESDVVLDCGRVVPGYVGTVR